MRRFAELMVVLLSAFVCNAGNATFSDARCRITFEYPQTWKVVVNPKERVWTADYGGKQLECTIGLRPSTWDAERRNDASGLLSRYPIAMAVVRAPFREVADRAGFTRFSIDLFALTDYNVPDSLAHLKEGDWLIAVRGGDVPAEQFRTSCCQAVIGDTWSRTQAKDGSTATYTGTTAVVNNRKGRSALIEAANADRFGPIAEAIAKTMRFQ